MADVFDFMTMLVMWIVGIICFIGLIVLFLISFVAHFRSKEHSWYSKAKWVLGGICIIGIVLALPYFIFSLAMLQKNTEDSIKCLKVAESIAVIPSIKAELNYTLVGFYTILKDGNNAIKYYERGVKFAGKPNKMYQYLICPVYFGKGDKEKVLETCNPGMISLYYLNSGDLKSALDNINSHINTLDEQKLNDICNARSIRAAINKKIGDKAAYKSDVDFIKSKSEKPYCKRTIKYAEADNIIDEYPITANSKSLKFK